ncbi:MAG: PhzF family phenazine biosynthesis protein [Cytophagales bacterium]|nr:MAG: PhzF family phenazine biosynthesis protein [Cytophagales bacterium]
MTIPFYLVDVFATARYRGNQLAVFDARDVSPDLLTTESMQAMAREINFQETTFVMGGSLDSGFEVRIFTPEYEIPFAGHPTLGTAWVLANRLVHSGMAPLTLNLGIGPIPVRWQGETPWLTAAQPQFGPTFDRVGMAQLLQLSPDDLDDGWPVERVSTGLLNAIVPVRTLDAMRRIRVDAGAFEAWLLANNQHKTNSESGLYTSLYVVCRETYEAGNQINARMFCLEQGRVSEDPATGSASLCLLGYLLKNKILGNGPVQARVEQGYEINRRSLLELAGERTDTYLLQVGGAVQFVAEGQWTL